MLKRLDMEDRTSTELKPFKIYRSQEMESFEHAVIDFLKEFEGTDDWPTVGVVGIAGEVNNNCVLTTNVQHWPISDGNAIAEKNKMKSFTFINDFSAAGYGICMLKLSDTIKINQITGDDDGVKVVMGPGTGLGVGFLLKPPGGRYHEIGASEGGHTDFSVITEEDWQLRQFAVKFIKESKNVENLRSGDVHLTRVSIERLCAGPALPLLYEFYKQTEEFKNAPLPLEEGKTTEELTSKDIISQGMNFEENGDKLCHRVIQKFAEIFAVEVGNCALKFLPNGGIYLVGGVTTGILDYLEFGASNEAFLKVLYDKGRLETAVRRVPLYVVRPGVELGIMGTEEFAFRKVE
jgi:glucokinase